MSVALAIFVKTPGFSPVKTRLAAEIGSHAAEAFHRLAAAAVGGVARAAAGLVAPFGLVAPVWAVAEAAALDHPDWSAFPTVPQGEGGLGERMGRVYSSLLAQHGAVLMVGADSPQMSACLLRRGVAALSPQTPYAIGPAEDGGFWLFGGRMPVPERVWTSVAYSRADTAARFLEALEPFGRVARLPRLFDVDTARDLPAVREALAALASPLPEQAALLQWLRDFRVPESVPASIPRP